MPRPVRMQYENAFYHVMNRGRGRRWIFHGRAYYKAFLETPEESHGRFDSMFHAYCMMGNHFHLLIETPLTNLDRIIRHINGVYTHRYNPVWLNREGFVLNDNDTRTKEFYDGDFQTGIFGDQSFRQSVYDDREYHEVASRITEVIDERPELEEIVAVVARVYSVDPNEIIKKKRGRQCRISRGKSVSTVAKDLGAIFKNR